MNPFVHSRVALCDIFGVDDLPRHRSMTTRCKYVKKWMLKNYRIKADDINWGRCFIFSYLVAALTPHDLEFVTTGGHVILRDPLTGLYYDSDYVEGCDDIECFFGCMDVNVISRREMTMFWGNRGTHREDLHPIVNILDPDDQLNKMREYDFDIPLFEAKDLARV
jgi:hypothetical protein